MLIVFFRPFRRRWVPWWGGGGGEGQWEVNCGGVCGGGLGEAQTEAMELGVCLGVSCVSLRDFDFHLFTHD